MSKNQTLVARDAKQFAEILGGISLDQCGTDGMRNGNR